MRNFFVADQCTKRHNKNSQPGCLDVFDKNLYTLLDIGQMSGCIQSLQYYSKSTKINQDQQ